jgi:hypothetical protein
MEGLASWFIDNIVGQIVASLILSAIPTIWGKLTEWSWPTAIKNMIVTLAGLMLILFVISSYRAGNMRTTFSDKEIEADIRSKLDQMGYSIRREQPRGTDVFRLSLAHEGLTLDLAQQRAPSQTIAIIASLDIGDLKQYPLKDRQRFILEIKAELLKFGVQLRDLGTAENPTTINIAHVFVYSNRLSVVDLGDKLFFVKRALKLVEIQAALQAMSLPPPKAQPS